MDKCARHRGMRTISQRLPALVVGGPYHLSAETVYRGKYGCRSLLDHEGLAGHSGLARRQRHSLRSVARADRPNTAPALVLLSKFRQKPDRVISSPNLEGADGLQALQLQENFGRAVVIQPHQRSAYSGFIDVPARVFDERRRNLALRRTAAGCQTGSHLNPIRPKI